MLIVSAETRDALRRLRLSTMKRRTVGLAPERVNLCDARRSEGN